MPKESKEILKIHLTNRKQGGIIRNKQSSLQSQMRQVGCCFEDTDLFCEKQALKGKKRTCFAAESCRPVRVQQRRPCRMDCRGRTRRREAVKSDGLFPRYQGKACDGTSLSGRNAPIWVAPQKFSGFCPKDQFRIGLSWTRVVFSCPERPRRKEQTSWQMKTSPTKST